MNDGQTWGQYMERGNIIYEMVFNSLRLAGIETMFDLLRSALLPSNLTATMVKQLFNMINIYDSFKIVKFIYKNINSYSNTVVSNHVNSDHVQSVGIPGLPPSGPK
jgi:hypothetical protein